MSQREKGEGEIVQIKAILPVEMYEKLRKAAFDEDRTQTAIMRDAIGHYLARTEVARRAALTRKRRKTARKAVLTRKRRKTARKAALTRKQKGGGR
jgi:predicted DNA-binding protein